MSQSGTLTEAEREILWSVDEQGVRPAEIARTSHLTPSAVRTILSRARRKRQ